MRLPVALIMRKILPAVLVTLTVLVTAGMLSSDEGEVSPTPTPTPTPTPPLSREVNLVDELRVVRAPLPTPNPTLAPTPIPTPILTPISQYVAAPGIESMIAAYFPEAPGFWIGVFRCESVGFREDVVYGPFVSRTGDRGLPQINEGWAGLYAERGWDYYAVPRNVDHDLIIARFLADSAMGASHWACA